MIFTFPVYITLKAKTEAEAHALLKEMLESEHILKAFSFTISAPINKPDCPRGCNKNHIHQGAAWWTNDSEEQP